jgi:hypothetical protein
MAIATFSFFPPAGPGTVVLLTGAAEILDLRKGMWEKISSRQHNPIKVFPFGENADEMMLYGTVEYEFKAGGKASIDWAARARMLHEGGKIRMTFYQVYLDSSVAQSK